MSASSVTREPAVIGRLKAWLTLERLLILNWVIFFTMNQKGGKTFCKIAEKVLVLLPNNTSKPIVFGNNKYGLKGVLM